MVTGEELKQLIEQHLPGAQVTIRDLTGTSDHFDVEVCAAQFEGKTRIEQHKMIHAAVGDHLGGSIHALQLRTSTP